MTKDELSDWLLNKILYCYPVKNVDFNNCILWIYDENYIRKLKLCKLNNQTITSPNKIKGICLFEQELNNNLLLFNYDEIWDFFENNYSNNDYEIQHLIYDILKDNTKLNGYEPWMGFFDDDFLLNNKSKLNIL